MSQRIAVVQLKHWDRSLRHETIEAVIDDARRQVRVKLSRIDTELLRQLIVDVLPLEYEVVAFERDDDRTGVLALRSPAPYELLIDVGEAQYLTRVVLLPESVGGRAAVSMRPVRGRPGAMARPDTFGCGPAGYRSSMGR